MKANELRIGNWVRSKYPINKETFQVYQMAFKQMPTTKDHDLDLSSWEPIPLTEEWLVKLGFKEIKENDSTKSFLYQSSDRCDYIAYSHEYGIDFFYSEHEYLKPRFVHTLQNLYFALTGEELTIEL